MKDNEDNRIPYVSKELCEYLRQELSLSSLLVKMGHNLNGDRALGFMTGVNMVLELLEAIQIRQEEDNGIYR